MDPRRWPTRRSSATQRENLSDVVSARAETDRRLGRGVVGGSITRGVARDFRFCTAKLVVQRSGSGATFVGAVTGLEQQRNGQWR